MKTTGYLIVLFCFLITVQVSAQQKIIFDADMNGDVDDVGALATLHALADRGEAEILACFTSHPSPAVCRCMDAINTWYRRPDLPIGALRGNGSSGQYAGKIANEFPNDIVRDETPEPVELYRQTLAAQPDSSVTIVTVGFLPNIAALLKSASDEYSDLDGVELVQQKVKEWVCMGGVFPEGTEYNLTNMYAEDAVYAVRNWPSKLIFTGWEIGKEIITGQYVQKDFPNSPVKKAYQEYYCSWAFDGNPYVAYEHGHYSWDKTAVLMAVRGVSPYWDVVDEGYCHMNEDATNEWRTDQDKNHQYVVPLMPNEEIADEINELMNQSPVGAHFTMNTRSGWLPFTLQVDASLSNPGFGNSVLEYQWDFGDGSTGSGEATSHEYQSAGCYPIELKITTDKYKSFIKHDSVLVSDPVFAPHPVFGHAGSYHRMNKNLWSTHEHLGDMRYYLNNHERNSAREFDGFSFFRDSLYSTFTFQSDICIGEDLDENRSADFKLVFGFQDSVNYNVIHFRNRSSFVMTFKEGHRDRVGRLDADGIPDENFHSIWLTNDGENFSVYRDGQKIFTSQDENVLRAGEIGFGSDKSAVYFDNIHIDAKVTGVDSETHLPVKYSMQQNYPNPFNPETTLTYSLSSAAHISLYIYDVKGRLVRTLEKGHRSAGEHRIIWRGLDDSGRRVSSGIYFARLVSEDSRRVIRMNLLR